MITRTISIAALSLALSACAPSISPERECVEAQIAYLQAGDLYRRAPSQMALDATAAASNWATKACGIKRPWWKVWA